MRTSYFWIYTDTGRYLRAFVTPSEQHASSESGPSKDRKDCTNSWQRWGMEIINVCYNNFFCKIYYTGKLKAESCSGLNTIVLHVLLSFSLTLSINCCICLLPLTMYAAHWILMLYCDRLPLTQCKQKFSSMDSTLKKNIKGMIQEHMDKYG